jgi:hypothetical protein
MGTISVVIADCVPRVLGAMAPVLYAGWTNVLGAVEPVLCVAIANRFHRYGRRRRAINFRSPGPLVHVSLKLVTLKRQSIYL